MPTTYEYTGWSTVAGPKVVEKTSPTKERASQELKVKTYLATTGYSRKQMVEIEKGVSATAETAPYYNPTTGRHIDGGPFYTGSASWRNQPANRSNVVTTASVSVPVGTGRESEAITELPAEDLRQSTITRAEYMTAAPQADLRRAGLSRDSQYMTVAPKADLRKAPSYRSRGGRMTPLPAEQAFTPLPKQTKAPASDLRRVTPPRPSTRPPTPKKPYNVWETLQKNWGYQGKEVKALFDPKEQKRRWTNVGSVYAVTGENLASEATFGVYQPRRTLQANVNNLVLKRGLEFTANRPATTALMIATAGTGIPALAGGGAKAAAIGTGSKLGRLAIGYPLALGAGEAGRLGVELMGISTAREQTKPYFMDPYFETVVKESMQSEKESLETLKGIGIPFTDKELPNLRAMAHEIPVVNLFVGDKPAYKRRAKELWQQRGLTGKELGFAVEASMLERRISSAGEAGAFAMSSARIEQSGRQLFRLAYPKGLPITYNFGKRFATGFKFIAPLGAAEAASQEVIQQRARRQKANIGQIGIEAGFGAVSAGLLGGGIVGVMGSKFWRRSLTGVAYALDWFEPVGDIMTSAAERGARQFKNIFIPTASAVTLRTKTKGGYKTTVYGPKPRDVKPGGYTPKGAYLSPVITYDVPVPIQETPIVPVPVPPPKDTITPVPDKPKTDFPSVTFPDITPVPDTPIPAETTTTVPTSTFVGVSVPVVTPIMRLPPPMLLPPFGFPGGTGGYGRGRRGKKYVSELLAARTLFRGLVSPRAIPVFHVGDVMKQPSRKAMKKRQQEWNKLFYFGGPMSKKKKVRKKSYTGYQFPLIKIGGFGGKRK